MRLRVSRRLLLSSNKVVYLRTDSRTKASGVRCSGSIEEVLKELRQLVCRMGGNKSFGNEFVDLAWSSQALGPDSIGTVSIQQYRLKQVYYAPDKSR